MSSESERNLSLDELRQRNQRQLLSTLPEPHPTVEEWENLLDWVIDLHQLIKEQNRILAQLQMLTPQPQLKMLSQDVTAIREQLQQAGKKKEQHFSLPQVSLPHPSWTWLIIPAVLVGLGTLWYSLVTILKALGM